MSTESKCDRCGIIPARSMVRLSWQTWETANLCEKCRDKQLPLSMASYQLYYKALPEIEKERLSDN